MPLLMGNTVRVWDGDRWRYGEYLGTIEKSGRRFGWRRVRVRKLRQDSEGRWYMGWRTERVRPDHVREVQ